MLIPAPGIALLIVRILDEEKPLTQQLVGHTAYTRKVRHRLVPRCGDRGVCATTPGERSVFATTLAGTLAVAGAVS